MLRAIAAVLLFVSSFTHASADAPRTIKMEVNGLVCAFCAHGIKRALEKYDAATDVFVDLEDRLVAVDLAQGKDIADADLDEALTQAGYTVVKIERSRESFAAIKAAYGDGDE
jgi:mercuric ion binding protein